MKIELCTECERRYTAEGVCVPCQGERCAGATFQPATAAARGRPGEYHPPRSTPAAVKAICAPEPAPDPEPHTLDAMDGKEPLQGSVLAVFEVLRDFDFNGTGCHPSEQTIADRLNVDRSTVVRAKVQLRRDGWIDWTREWAGPRAKWQHCVYKILAGWVRPFRKPLLQWLDERRSKAEARANASLNELQRPYVEKETQRSKGRRVKKPWFGPFNPTNRKARPPTAVTADNIRRCGGHEAAIAFATWTPHRLAA